MFNKKIIKNQNFRKINKIGKIIYPRDIFLKRKIINFVTREMFVFVLYIYACM